MIPRCSRPVLSVPLALIATMVLTTPSEADDITLTPGATVQSTGGRISGTITSETPTVLRIDRTTGGPLDVPVDQIASITYTGQPASLPLAESNQASGALTEALDLYARSASEASGKPLIAQRAQFGRAQVLASLAETDPARADEAITALEGFIKANPTSRHLGPALESLARLALSRGDLDRAASAATQLRAISWATDRAAILEARIGSARGQSDQALSALDALQARAPEGSRLAVETSLTRAEILAAAKKYPEAEAAARAVIEAAEPEAAEIQGLAYNTLGACLQAAGKTKDALYAYLHTDILYDADPEQHARSLASIADLWRTLGRADRADEALGRLRQLYPKSPYLKETPQP